MLNDFLNFTSALIWPTFISWWNTNYFWIHFCIWWSYIAHQEILECIQCWCLSQNGLKNYCFRSQCSSFLMVLSFSHDWGIPWHALACFQLVKISSMVLPHNLHSHYHITIPEYQFFRTQSIIAVFVSFISEKVFFFFAIQFFLYNPLWLRRVCIVLKKKTKQNLFNIKIQILIYSLWEIKLSLPYLFYCWYKLFFSDTDFGTIAF
jgi:hypothetical protein